MAAPRPFVRPYMPIRSASGTIDKFPKRVVEDQIERDEDAVHRGLLQQQERIKFAGAVLNHAPGDEYAKRRQEGHQHHQPHRKAIHANVILDGRIADPGNVQLILKPLLLLIVKVCRQMQRHHKEKQRQQQRKHLRSAPASRHQQHHHRASRG